MKTITQLKDDIAILMKKIGDTRALCVQENREANEGEMIGINGWLTEVSELENRVKLEERTQATLDRLERSKVEPDKPAVIPERITVVEQETRDRFPSAGEFFQAVLRAGQPGGSVDRRLSTRAASGLNESVPSDGGFLVESEIANGILKTLWGTGQILPKVSKVTLSGNKNGMKFNGLDETSRADGSRAGGIQAYWAAEAAEKTKSKPKFRQIALNLNKLIGLCYATDEMLDDASALSQEITSGFHSEFDFKLTDAIINGTGAGQPLGIMNAGCAVTVAKEGSQTAATVVYENIVKMWSRMIASSRPNAVWLINQDVEPQLHTMSLSVGTAGGGPVYLPSGGASASPYSTIYGRPVIPIEQCQTVGTAGDIILADLSQYKAIDKGGIQDDVSIHVRFIYDESVFRFVYRFDGEPILASAITPKNGTNTLSHFVNLAERS